jgi:hypothetical protein
MSAIRGYEQLLAALNALRGQWRRRKLAEGLLLTLAGLLVLAVVAALIDNLFQPGKFVRALLFIGLLTGTAVLAFRRVVRYLLEERRDDFFAALVEEKHPTLRNRLINALQLGRGNQDGHSQVLIEKVVGDAADATAEMELGKSIDPRPLRRALGLFAAAAVVVAVYAGVVPERFANGLKRVMMPFSDIPAYTRTHIPDVKPGNTRVPEGDSFVVEATVAGVVPGSATLHRKLDGRWQEVPMQPDPARPDTFRVELRAVTESFPYHVTAGDGTSKSYMIDVVQRPQVKAITLTYAYPGYTELAPRTIDTADGPVAAVAGTTVTVEVKTSKPLKWAKLVLKEGKGQNLLSPEESGPVVRLSRGNDESTWTGTFVLSTAGAKLPNDIVHPVVEGPDSYQIQLMDTEGYANADPLWRTIHVARDQPPAIAILKPTKDQVPVRPADKLELAVQARDDFGVADVKLLYRFPDDRQPRELAAFPLAGAAQTEPAPNVFTWELSALKLKGGELIQYWAVAADRNTVTGPGRGESRKHVLIVVGKDPLSERLKEALGNYAAVLEELIRLQTENRTKTELLRLDDTAEDRKPAAAFAPLLKRETLIRAQTNQLARAMEADGVPLRTLIQELDDLRAGLMAQAVKLFEQGQGSQAATKADEFRAASLPVQDKIIEQLKAMLARIQKNEQAKKALERMAKTDKPAHDKITTTIADLMRDLNKHLKDATQLASKFEKLPKKPGDELKNDPDALKAVKEYDEFKKRTEKWTKESVNEMTKLGSGFVDDFALRKDANRIFEEIEAKGKSKAENLDVALEDLGSGLATKMKEDLEMWLPDAADNVKWNLEEPKQQKPFKVPEMPLPKALEDMIGELLQKADEFDEEADDVTSAWADNLDQAGWGVSDGPISSFSAKGKTGNDQPNSNEVNGRSGDGRRGKSAGQMVGDTSRALPGRKTPARVGNEKYEPGSLKQEGSQDPNGATGGGKKAGAGRIGLQGGTPPDVAKDVGRLNEKQMGLREKAEQVARKLEEKGYSTARLRDAIELMKPLDADGRDLKYDDLARKRKEALQKLRGAFGDVDPTAASISRARDLPLEMRQELLQGHDEGYPAGYESLLKNYYKKLSGDGK